MLRVIQHFDRYYSCHSQGVYVGVGRFFGSLFWLILSDTGLAKIFQYCFYTFLGFGSLLENR